MQGEFNFVLGNDYARRAVYEGGLLLWLSFEKGAAILVKYGTMGLWQRRGQLKQGSRLLNRRVRSRHVVGRNRQSQHRSMSCQEVFSAR